MTGTYWIPPKDDQLTDVFFYLEGIEDVKALVSVDRQEAMLAVRMPADSRGRYAELMDAVRQAETDSAETGAAAAKIRLNAMSRIYDVKLSEGRVDHVVAMASTPMTDAEAAEIQNAIKTWIDSEDSPWNPTPEEWTAISPTLSGDAEAIAAAINAQPTWIEQGNDREMAVKVAESILVRRENTTIENRASAMLTELTAGVDAPKNFGMRARGILSSLVAPQPEGSQDLQFAISGYPAFTKASEDRLQGGLKMAVVLLFLTAMAYVMLLGFRNPTGLLVLPVGLASTMATFAVSGALGLGADPNSASIYLIAPLVWLFLSEMLNDDTGLTTRNPTFFALALAAGGTSLLMFGVTPVSRIGAALCLSLVITVAMFAAVRRLYFKTVKA